VGYGGDDVDRIIWLLRHASTEKGFVDRPPLRRSAPVTVTSSTVTSLETDLAPFRRNTSDEDEDGGMLVHFVGGTGNETSTTEASRDVGLVNQSEYDALFPPSTEKLDSMSGLAHGLHFASIGMLGFLVLEVSVRVLRTTHSTLILSANSTPQKIATV